MKLTMKLTTKLFLIISLFCSVTFAEGDMDGGTLTGDMDGGTLNCTECIIDADENSNRDKKNDSDDSILDIIQKYLSDLLG